MRQSEDRTLVQKERESTKEINTEQNEKKEEDEREMEGKDTPDADKDDVVLDEVDEMLSKKLPGDDKDEMGNGMRMRHRSSTLTEDTSLLGKKYIEKYISYFIDFSGLCIQQWNDHPFLHLFFIHFYPIFHLFFILFFINFQSIFYYFSSIFHSIFIPFFLNFFIYFFIDFFIFSFISFIARRQVQSTITIPIAPPSKPCKQHDI